jgi:general secretion pathway protein J
MTRVRQQGFTLIEIMVAVAIFAVMSVMAWGALGRSLSDAEMLTDRMDRLQAIQRSVRFITTDLSQAAPRSVRSELGYRQVQALLSSLTSEFAIELTHGGWNNPAGLPRGSQQRSAYRLEEDKLVRYHWNVLDRTYSNEPVVIVLLDDVEGLAFLFYDESGASSDIWPPQNAVGSTSARIRPRAVELILSRADVGKITRLVEVAP